ncbi:MAG: ABC transporter substrate-binding protein [Defluviitaleaceae bacterium]|nr:ABC transporter substrate-binding protein [Defluviitaleaceae bacterium]MCL2276150.1 ABC transporter substrate-binding protein [Defluviitaleaceae bacterium]
MKKLFMLLAVTALALTAMTACRGDNGDTPDRLQIPAGHPMEMLALAQEVFPDFEDNGLPHVDGTIFQWGLAHPTPWVGVIGGGGVFSIAAIDSSVANLIGSAGGLFNGNELNQFGPGGVWELTANMENRSVTINQMYDVFWHDGHPLTVYDLYFTLHVMAHPDHVGPRHFRTDNNQDIVGIWDYNEGVTDTIAGLVLSENNTVLTIYFEEFAPTIMYFGFWTSPMPAHIFGAYYPHNVAGMMDSPHVRETPIGWGPFEFVHAEPGESFLLRRNENFVWGAPYIEYMVVRRVAPDMIADAMVAGQFDAVGFRALDFPYHASPSNWRYFGAPARVRQNHFAFRMGWWCFETNENVSEMVFGDDHPRAGEQRYHEMMRPEAWYIRAAMAKAIDWMTITQVRYQGLNFPAGSYLPLLHRYFMDLTVPMFPHSIEEANAILDRGGFTNRDSEGYRTWLDGSRMELIWAASEGPDAEWYYQAHTQAWRDVGIRVSLWQGVFHDIFTIWDAMDFDTDDDEVHFWTGGWNHSSNPANNMWSRSFFENGSRHVSYELDGILDRINSSEAWDMDFLLQAMSDLQWYMYNTIFYFPTTWGIGITAVNNRVANWDTRPHHAHLRDSGWHLTRLTAAEPYRG